MTAPRQILPGSTYLITRRCLLRSFFLKPSKTINDIFLYCLAYAARTYHIRVHAFCVMSNHFHLVVTDTKGLLPDFMHRLDMYVARAVNSHLDRSEYLWAPGSYSMVELPDEQSILDKIAYTLGNPVEAGLVRKGHQWPGLRTDPRQMGRATLVVERPEGFFGTSMPERIRLKVTVPRMGGMSAAEFRARAVEAVQRHEAAVRRKHEETGRRFLGRRGVLRQSPFGRPRGHAPRFGIKPRVASKDTERRVTMLRRLRGFLEAYDHARQRYEAGEHQVCFPAGTWLMRHRYGVRCEAPP